MTAAVRRAIVRDFLGGHELAEKDMILLARKYKLPAYGIGLSGSIEGIIRRALQEPRKRKRR